MDVEDWERSKKIHSEWQSKRAKLQTQVRQEPEILDDPEIKCFICHDTDYCFLRHDELEFNPVAICSCSELKGNGIPKYEFGTYKGFNLTNFPSEEFQKNKSMTDAMDWWTGHISQSKTFWKKHFTKHDS